MTSKNKVFVGTNDAAVTNEGTLSKINEDLNLATNNTIFVKDGITLSPDNGANKTHLDIDYLRRIKYLPYHFDQEMCIGGTCINKYNIKYIKGKIPFSINTFTDLVPFQGYTEPGYSGWKTMMGTQPQKNISIADNPLRGIQITSDLYKVTAYSEPEFQGFSHDITESTSDLTGLFPEGVKSIIPKSKKGNLLNNTCLGKDSLVKQGGTATGYFPAM